MFNLKIPPFFFAWEFWAKNSAKRSKNNQKMEFLITFYAFSYKK
jgi:hypothetical protein